jgi:hypothetical protein
MSDRLEKIRPGVKQNVEGEVYDAVLEVFLKNLSPNERKHIEGFIDTLNVDANPRLQKKIARCFADVYLYGIKYAKAAIARGEDPEVWKDKFSAEVMLRMDKSARTANLCSTRLLKIFQHAASPHRYRRRGTSDNVSSRAN